MTIDEALAQVRITQDTENGLIAGYLLAARTYAEKVTRACLMKQTWLYTIDYHWPFVRQENPAYFIMPYYFWRSRIELAKYPVMAVQSIQYVDINGTPQTLDPSQYVSILNESTPYVEPVFGVDWPTPRYQPAAISITMDCGFGSAPSDMPENIRQAILLLVSYWYDNRGSAQFGARGRAGQSGSVTSSLMPAEIPPGVDALLSLDRHVRIISSQQ